MSRIATILFLLLISGVFAQTEQSDFIIPSVDVKSIDGKKVSTKNIFQTKGVQLILFWKSCCPVNKTLMDDISEMIDDNDLLDSRTVYAFCIDDTRSYIKARTLASSSDWPFQFYFDVNSDFKRAMSVNLTPSFILIKNGQILLQTNGYVNGQIELILENLN